ncbi:MAG: DUF1028 domain-containing protein [Bacteroidota bacterium]
MTFTVIGRDPASGALGVATATGSIAVGAQVPHCRYGVGAIATQGHTTNLRFPRRGLPLLAQGQPAAQVLRSLVDEDPERDFRQLAVMDRNGGTAGWTGRANGDFKDHHAGDGVIVAGNILRGPQVLEAMLAAYDRTADAELAERLLAALAAGEAAGGDRRGTRSAALLCDTGAGAALNLRIDYSEAPVAALQALHERSRDREYRDFLRRLPDGQDLAHS